jgi:hypothetical protein
MARRLPASSFDLVRYHRANERIFLYAFDLIELNGDDLRPDPLENRKATLEMILAKAGSGIRFNEHMEGDGETVVSARLQARPRRHCLEAEGFALPLRSLARLAQKMKNANAPAVKREEDWGKGR